MALDKKAFKELLTDRLRNQAASVADQMLKDFPEVSAIEVSRVDTLTVRLRVRERNISGPHYFDVRVKETY